MELSEQSAEPPIVNIVGEKVALGPCRRDLMPLYDRWFNDFEVGMPYFVQLRPHTREAREVWYEKLAKDDPSVTNFQIYERTTMRPIGRTFPLTRSTYSNGQPTSASSSGRRTAGVWGYGTETGMVHARLRVPPSCAFTTSCCGSIATTNARSGPTYGPPRTSSDVGHEACPPSERTYDIVHMEYLAHRLPAFAGCAPCFLRASQTHSPVLPSPGLIGT